MATLQVKGIDDDLYGALRRRAELENRSISQQVVHIIESFLSQESAAASLATAQFLELCGSWSGEEAAEDLIQDLRKSRKSSGRRSGTSLSVFD
ncbi:antitoxin [Planctomycetota bacterium]